MMKKIIALTMCLTMLLACTAIAETANAEKDSMGVLNVNGAFELKCALPEGYALDIIYGDGGNMIANISANDVARPTMILSLAFNDSYADVERLNDLDADTHNAIMNTFMEEDEVEISTMTTAYGTELFVIKEIKDTVEYVDFYTIYKGYEIEMVLNHIGGFDPTANEMPEIIPVTDEEIQLAIQFLSDLDFVAVVE